MCLQYYGPYGDIKINNYSVPKPYVNVDIVPGCNILRNQFAVANYSGPLPCMLQGQGAPAPAASADGRRLMQAAFTSTNISTPCVVCLRPPDCAVSVHEDTCFHLCSCVFTLLLRFCGSGI